ncbi:MAG: hypothetical protein ACOC9R_03155 [bacterium]
MTTATVEQIGAHRVAADRSADLQNAHLEAAKIVAALDLGDSQLWRQIDRVVAALASAAYDLTGTLTGQPAGPAAASLPPVVRARELAAAQRGLSRALNQHPSPAGELIDRAADHAEQLVRALWHVTLSTQRDADDGER